MFRDDAVETEAAAAGVGVAAGTLRAPWEATVLPVLEEATLVVPAATPFVSRGKQGLHSEHLGHLLAEMQTMQRSFPGARW
jgi:ring-1,2-phenylacetyl-CoA epoxidase subunit PaaC